MSSFDAFFDYIQKISGMLLSDENKHLLVKHFKPRHLRKRHYFLQDGDVCNHIGFIIKGSAKTFTVDDKGRENIMKLALENWWLADFESFYRLTPTRFNIEALEDLEILQTTNTEIENFLKRIPAFLAMSNIINQNNTIATQKRIQNISYSAEERYAELINDYPDFIQRFPQNMIASYLGLSSETLSRIKKNALK